MVIPIDLGYGVKLLNGDLQFDEAEMPTHTEFANFVLGFQELCRAYQGRLQSMTTQVRAYGVSRFSEPVVDEIWGQLNLPEMTQALTLKHGTEILRISAATRQMYPLSDKHWWKITSKFRKLEGDKFEEAVIDAAATAIEMAYSPSELQYYLETKLNPRAAKRKGKSGTGSGFRKSLTHIVQFDFQQEWLDKTMGGKNKLLEMDRAQLAEILQELAPILWLGRDIEEKLAEGE